VKLVINFINRYNIVITELHNAEKKILDLKEEIKEQNRQNGDVSEIVKKLVQEKQELENQLRKSYLNLTRIILRPLSALSLDEGLNSPCDKNASAVL
jgi:chromosome segregation ATPase